MQPGCTAAGAGPPRAELPSLGNPHGAAPETEVAISVISAIRAAEPPCLAAGASCPPPTPPFPHTGRSHVVVRRVGYGHPPALCLALAGPREMGWGPSFHLLHLSIPCISPSPLSLHPRIPPCPSRAAAEVMARWDRGQGERSGNTMGSRRSIPASRWRWPKRSIRARGRGQPSGGWGSAVLSGWWQSDPLGMLKWANWGLGGSCPFSLSCKPCKPPFGHGAR